MVRMLGVIGTPVTDACRSTSPSRRNRFPLAATAALAMLAGSTTGWLPGAVATAAAQTVFIVDGSSAACSATGPGTSASPYCTISAALLAHHDPGTTIQVMPGVYHEQVTVPASGLPGSPIVLQAMGTDAAPVVIDGADDFGSPSLWVQQPGGEWLASSVTWTPFQVFVDGGRLAASTAAPDALPSGSFTVVAGQGLYVNLGGDNPGAHDTHVGHRLYGVFSSGKTSWVAKGFDITRAESRGIQLTGASSDITIEGNRVTFAGHAGIQVNGGTGITIRSNVSSNNGDHGISLLTGTTSSTIEGNESFRNAFPTARQANGLYMFGASGNRIIGNRFHDNQDTGEHMQSGSNNNVSLQNCSWGNGDHGYDHLGATGNVHLGDVAFGNFRDGFEMEGNSGGTVLHDCIATDNGLGANGFDLSVDGTSTAGFDSDDNVFWNSTAQSPVRYAGSLFGSVAAYSTADGLDANTLQADPLFVDPAHGNFELRAGSPAIDNANSGVVDWPAADALGRARIDDPTMPNLGRGPVAFADRGAFEFQPAVQANLPPVAKLKVTPADGAAPLTVTAHAGESADPDGRIVSYQFDFGDGTTVGPQSDPNARHTFASGSWTVTVVVADEKGATARASAVVTASGSAGNQPPVARLALSAVSGTAPLAVVAHASASSDPDGRIVSYRFDFGDGTVVGPRSGPNALHTYAAGQWTASVTVTDDLGATASASVAVTVQPGPVVLASSDPYPSPGGTGGTDPGGEPRGGLQLTTESGAAPTDAAPRAPCVRPEPILTSGRLECALPAPGPVSLRIFDAGGRLVRTVCEQAWAPAGAFALEIDGRDSRGAPLRRGVYFLALETPDGRRAARFTVLR